MLDKVELSNEQQFFIEKALEGNNILVDACIGSGKTTAIQYLCEKIPLNKKVLYLTYNKLLKIDAQSKIHKDNVTVMNYHGFAFSMLKKKNIQTNVEDLIKKFNDVKPVIPKYDILIIDEYQDIELELAEMLNYIKCTNKNIQIIAVGDMEQKIYDKTTLDVKAFINDFLGVHTLLSFTYCFRLSKTFAEKLSRIWNKKIIGVNNQCEVISMSIIETVNFLSNQQPSDILCLGSRTGKMATVLNQLENDKKEKFNKKTVYASIMDSDSCGKVVPKSDSAIFTTYDSSKGLERKICVIFDYTESYWNVRASKPNQKYEILRNIFCVASSRGKNKIIFVDEDEPQLSEETISKNYKTNSIFNNDIGISDMFEFKYKENIEECYNLLSIKEINNDDHSIIDIKNTDELIDLSPCIGIYQEVCFFKKKNIDKDIKLALELNDRLVNYNKRKSDTIDRKILYLTSLETHQLRYVNQIKIPFISKKDSRSIKYRLSKYFSENDNVQVYCKIIFKESKLSTLSFMAIGYADVVKNNVVYELKFVSELSHEHFLQCACYMIGLKLNKGILFNTRNNQMYEISIPNKKKFMNAVVNTITKGEIKKYYGDAS